MALGLSVYCKTAEGRLSRKTTCTIQQLYRPGGRPNFLEWLLYILAKLLKIYTKAELAAK